MSELPEPKFRKTKSEKWAVMAPVETLEAALAGDGKVKVLKKSGDHSSFTVGSLGKPFDVDGIQMCYGYAPGDEDTSGQSSGGQSSGGQSSGGQGSGGQSGGGRPAANRQAPPSSQGPPPAPIAPPPPRDESEPLPEYQGEDQWDDAF